MVFPGEDDYMAKGPERSKVLDNLPFLNFKWGMQRRMKCTKVESGSDGSGASDDQHKHQHRSLTLEFVTSSVVIPFRFGEASNRSHPLLKLPSKSADKGSEEEIKESREKIERIKMAESMLRKDAVEDQEKDERPEEVKPWNLRRRKSSCKEPIRLSNENHCNEIETEERIVSRKRGRGVMKESEKKEPVKFSLKLSRKDIEVDFMQISGRRLHSRTKKRPRNVQKLVDNVFPGLYLTEVTPEMYKVPEVAEKGKNLQRS